MARPIIDLTGQRFNMLLALHRLSYKLNSRTVWLCQCDCGNVVTRRENDLKKAHSCGCKNKHGESKTRLHGIWHNIKQKCLNSNCEHYREGVTLQPDWRVFINFRNWAIQWGYTDAKQIKRSVTEKGFTAENCSWVLKSKL